MSTRTEVLAQNRLNDGAPFTATVSFLHMPTFDAPGLADFQSVLNAFANGIEVDAMAAGNKADAISLLSFGTNVFLELHCHVRSTEGLTGGQIVSAITQGLLELGKTFSIHTPNVEIVTIAADAADKECTGLAALNPFCGGPNPITALSLASLAIICVIGFVAYVEVKKAL
jgi:hypothetical protein